MSCLEKNWIKKLLKITIVVFIFFIITVTIVGIVFAIYIEKNISKTIDESIFLPIGTSSSTKIYCYDFEDRENRVGSIIQLTDYDLNNAYKCKSVSFDQIPKHMINAFISIEDKRFYEHKGVDWKRTLSAGVNYFFKFSDNFGGSTITQQLIKNVTQNDEYSFQRKLQEIFWALDLENKIDKNEILHMYLNIINLSDGCFGIGAASEYYFSKDISELNLAECACIAAITNSPTYYNPIKNPENNKIRRNIILKEMLDQGYITNIEYEEARTYNINVKAQPNTAEVKINSWYIDMVIDDVINDLMNEKGYSRAIANLMVYSGGLNIYTVMDQDVQKTLDEYYSESQNFYKSTDDVMPQSSMIVIDPKTGDILGVAGCIGEKNANRIQNYATQTLRPAGSVIKPISVYAPAIENGIINWATVYDDIPVNFGKYNITSISERVKLSDAWPKNSNGIYRGLTNINYAITHSVNTVTVRVLDNLGIENSFNYLYDKLNIKNIVSKKELEDGSVITDKDYAALALGQFNYGVTLREITAAYSIFANKGIYNEYRSYEKVTNYNGDIILSKPYNGKSVLSEDNATIMTMMLQNVVKEGTAKDITLNKKIDVAGKTGTTQNNYDKWFIGYTPYYICGTWLGYEYPESLSSFSGKSCNEIWDDVMTILHNKYITGKRDSFDLSSNVIKATYCADSGKLATEACKADMRGERTEVGYFTVGSVPSSFCDVHILVEYDKVYGGVASPECPDENKVKVGMIKVNRTFPVQIYVTDAQYVWRDIGKNFLPETSSALPFFSNLLKKNEFSGISYSEIQKNCYCRDHFNYSKWKEEKEK